MIDKVAMHFLDFCGGSVSAPLVHLTMLLLPKASYEVVFHIFTTTHFIFLNVRFIVISIGSISPNMNSVILA